MKIEILSPAGPAGEMRRAGRALPLPHLFTPGRYQISRRAIPVPSIPIELIELFTSRLEYFAGTDIERRTRG